MEGRALRIAVGVGCLVPILAGASGIWKGPGAGASIDLDSHFRYLSGLLCGIGLAFATTIPRIEAHGGRFLLLTAIVFVGGLGRLLSFVAIGAPSTAMQAALVMELLVTPALCLWQRRVARLG